MFGKCIYLGCILTFLPTLNPQAMAADVSPFSCGKLSKMQDELIITYSHKNQKILKYQGQPSGSKKTFFLELNDLKPLVDNVVHIRFATKYKEANNLKFKSVKLFRNKAETHCSKKEEIFKDSSETREIYNSRLADSKVKKLPSNFLNELESKGFHFTFNSVSADNKNCVSTASRIERESIQNTPEFAPSPKEGNAEGDFIAFKSFAKKFQVLAMSLKNISVAKDDFSYSSILIHKQSKSKNQKKACFEVSMGKLIDKKHGYLFWKKILSPLHTSFEIKSLSNGTDDSSFGKYKKLKLTWK